MRRTLRCVSPRPFAITIHDLIHLHFPHNFKRTVGPYYATSFEPSARGRRACSPTIRARSPTSSAFCASTREGPSHPTRRRRRLLARGRPNAATRPYFLYAGNHREHKDLRTLVDAWLALPDSYEAEICAHRSGRRAWVRLPRRRGHACTLSGRRSGRRALPRSTAARSHTSTLR